MKQYKKYRAKNHGVISGRIAAAVFVIYLLLLIYLTLFSQYFGRVDFHRSINLIPLSTIHRYLSCWYLGVAKVNLMGNIFAFIPFGLLLPMAAKKLRFLSILIYLFFVSAAIEIIQYLLGVGVSDIDDIILNLAGGIIGWLIFKVFQKISSRLGRKD